MAVRFSASGQHYTATTGIPATDLTAVCWAYLTTDRNDYSCLFSWENSASNATQYLQVASDADGTSLAMFWTGGGPAARYAVTTGTWHKIALLVSGSTGTFYAAAAGSALAQVATGSVPSVTRSNFFIGSDSFAEWWNGRLAGFKLWSAALTTAEMDHELSQYQPARTTNLLRYHPFVSAETVDYSGGAFTLSGGSGATTEEGPPIRWGAGGTRLILPLATTAASGALTASIPLLTAATAGTATTSGTATSSIPLPTAALTASATASGTAGAAIPLPAAALTGTARSSGSLSGTLGLPSATLGAGSSGSGTANGTLPLPVMAVSATSTGSGALQGGMPVPTTAMSGTASTQATAATSIPMSQAALTSGASTTGALKSGVYPGTGGYPGTGIYPGGGPLALPALGAALVGTVADAGTLTGGLPTPVADLNGVVDTGGGLLSTVLPLLGADLNAVGATSGGLVVSLPPLEGELVGVGVLAGTATGVLPGPEGALSGQVAVNGHLVGALPLPRCAATGRAGRSERKPVRAGSPVVTEVVRTGPTESAGEPLAGAPVVTTGIRAGTPLVG